MISQELETSLHLAFVAARQQRHEFITVEHLLLCMLDNPSARAVILACSTKKDNATVIDNLRKDLETLIKKDTPVTAGTHEVDTLPTLGFQRVCQRAIMHVDSSHYVSKITQKKEVTGANILVALFGERDSFAVHFLHQQSISRLDVVNHVVHGIRRDGKPEIELEKSLIMCQTKIEMSAFQFFMKLKDGEADPRFVKLTKKFKALMKKEGLDFKPGSEITPSSFLSSDKVALLSSREKSKFTLHKK